MFIPEEKIRFVEEDGNGAEKNYAWEDRKEEQLEELRNLLHQRAYPDYTIKIHALKGTALNIGAKQVAELARLLEQAGRKEDQSYMESHMEEFHREYCILLDHIRAVLDDCGLLEDVQKQKEKEGQKDADILHLLEDIKKSVEEYDFARASGIVREAAQYPLQEEHKEMFSQIGQSLDEMEMEKVQEIIGKYLPS